MKKSIFAWSVAALVAASLTSCQNQSDFTQEEVKYGKLEFSFRLESSADKKATRADGETGGSGSTNPYVPGQSSTEVAAVSTAIPVTSWDNIKDIQLFVADANGVVQFTRYISREDIVAALANPNANNNGTLKFIYSQVPEGTYFVSAVANSHASGNPANSFGGIVTNINDVPKVFDDVNPLSNNIYDITMTPKPTNFPVYYANQVAASPVTRTEHAFAPPTELFMARGYLEGSNENGQVAITITPGVAAKVCLDLTREVSLMRLRINLTGDETTTNIAHKQQTAGGFGNPNGTIDFTQNTCIMVANLPKEIHPMYRKYTVNGGDVHPGTSPMSVPSSRFVYFPIGGTGICFHTTDVSDPSWNAAQYGSYNEGGKIIGQTNDEFKADAWRDMYVFRNDKVMNSTATGSLTLARANRYLLIISALGLPGHLCNDGTVLAEKTTIYWVGYIDQAFVNNQIREVNIKLKDGGSVNLPEPPDNTGSLEIILKEPKPWDSNIQASKLEM